MVLCENAESLLFAGNVWARLPRYVIVGEILRVSRHSPCPCHGSQVGSLAPMLGTWGCQLPQGPGGLPPPSPRAPGPCPLHTIGISSLGPDGPGYLILGGLLIQGSAGLRWGPGESVLTHPHGRCRLSEGGSSVASVAPAQLCPQSSKDLSVGGWGRRASAGAMRHVSLHWGSRAFPPKPRSAVRHYRSPTWLSGIECPETLSLAAVAPCQPLLLSCPRVAAAAVRTALGSPTRHTSASLLSPCSGGGCPRSPPRP